METTTATRSAKATKPALATKSSREPGVTKPTKRAELIRLLSRKSGVTSAALCTALGWQAHSLRAAISGLRKAGFAIEAIKPQDGGATVLRITAGPQVP